MKIADIKWAEAVFIDAGSSGRVFRVGPGVVVKIAGWLNVEDPNMQRTLAKQNYAVPVIDFVQECRTVPRHIAKEVRRCFIHDLGSTKDWHQCECSAPISVLMMPEVTRASDHVPREEIVTFMGFIETFMAENYDRGWDAHSGNVGWYQDHIVALDFEF